MPLRTVLGRDFLRCTTYCGCWPMTGVSGRYYVGPLRPNNDDLQQPSFWALPPSHPSHSIFHLTTIGKTYLREHIKSRKGHGRCLGAPTPISASISSNAGFVWTPQFMVAATLLTPLIFVLWLLNYCRRWVFIRSGFITVIAWSAVCCRQPRREGPRWMYRWIRRHFHSKPATLAHFSSTFCLFAWRL